jgi:hypothetical protein
MRDIEHRWLNSILARGAAGAAVLALVIQPCVVCLSGDPGTTAFATLARASTHGADVCGARSNPTTESDRPGQPEGADGCPSLSAGGPAAIAPTTALPGLPDAPATVTIDPLTPSYEEEPADPDGLRNDRVPLFLRHASLRI